MVMECRNPRHVRIAVRAAYSARMSVATSRAQARSRPADCEGRLFEGGQFRRCCCRPAQALWNAAARWRDRTRVRSTNLIARCVVMVPATNLFMALAWTFSCSTPDRARRSGSWTASSAWMQRCIWSELPISGRGGVPEDSAAMRPGSSPPPVPEFGEMISQAATARSVSTIAAPPTIVATSWSSTRSSPPGERHRDELKYAPSPCPGNPPRGGSLPGSTLRVSIIDGFATVCSPSGIGLRFPSRAGESFYASHPFNDLWDTSTPCFPDAV